MQEYLFVCVEILRPSQPNGVMSSAVSLPNHTFTTLSSRTRIQLGHRGLPARILHSNQATYVLDIYENRLIEDRGDSNKYPKHMFYEEIRIYQSLSYMSFCPLRISYNSK